MNGASAARVVSVQKSPQTSQPQACRMLRLAAVHTGSLRCSSGAMKCSSPSVPGVRATSRRYSAFSRLVRLSQYPAPQ